VLSALLRLAIVLSALLRLAIVLSVLLRFTAMVFSNFSLCLKNENMIGHQFFNLEFFV
jgi:hypothetical protein